jgi:tRNA (guanine-N7-)-methyltransferase
LEWATIFQNQNAVEIEVGFGKGLFLVNAGQAHPEINYLGIEILRKYQLFTATRLAKCGLHNVRVTKADARLCLRDCVACESVQCVRVYFPDPWWKRRHRKRRIFTPEFVVQGERVLQVGGSLDVATDVEEYFAVISRLIAEHTALVGMAGPQEAEPRGEWDYLTNFERKFRRAGRTIYRGIFRRVRRYRESH